MASTVCSQPKLLPLHIKNSSPQSYSARNESRHSKMSIISTQNKCGENPFLGNPLKMKVSSQSYGRKLNRIQVLSASAQSVETGTKGGILDFLMGLFKGKKTESATEPVPDSRDTKEYQRTVFVAGATGRTGKFIVKQMLQKGYKVVAYVTSSEKAENLVEEIRLGSSEAVKGKLVTAVGSLLDEFAVEVAMDGCDSLVFALGSKYAPNGFVEGSSPQVDSVGAFRNERPQLVLISSAAVERNARIQVPEEREMSIPIVKLNPGRVLTWKLHGEDTLKASGLRYTIVRPCGLTDKDMGQPFNIEVAQGNCITGLLSREEAARVCVEVLDSPFTANTTFEVRRDLTKGLEMKDWGKLFTSLRPDVRPNSVQSSVEPPKEEKVETESSKVDSNSEVKGPSVTAN